MLNLPLLGLPYVQPAHSGVLIIRHEKAIRFTFLIYRFGSILWKGEISVKPDIPQLGYFRLKFQERPNGLSFAVFVHADFGPRVDYVVFPINCIFPTTKVGNYYLLSSKDIFYSDSWVGIVSQIRSATANHMAMFKRKLKPAFPFTSESLWDE
jgi:hypothetical protein